MLETYIAIYTIDIMALFFLLGLLQNNNIIGTHRKKPFSYGIVFTILVMLLEAGTMAVDGRSGGLRSLNILYNVLGFILTPIIPITLITIFDQKILRANKLLLLPTALNIIVVISSPFVGWIFYINANNYYQRGNIFFVFVIAYIVNIIFLLLSILHLYKKTLYPMKWKIISLTFFTIAGTFIQLLIPSIHTSWHCVSISLFLLYILLTEFDGSFDTLTGLYNRATFIKTSKQLTDKKAFSVVVFDINNFKEINDTYGHEYGDAVLKEVAKIIRTSFNNYCSCYRFGGDEFYSICMNTNKEKLENQLKDMTNSLAKERQDDRHLPTVAYGYSIFRGDKILDFENMLKEADDQMYYYKQQHKKKDI